AAPCGPLGRVSQDLAARRASPRGSPRVARVARPDRSRRAMVRRDRPARACAAGIRSARGHRSRPHGGRYPRLAARDASSPSTGSHDAGGPVSPTVTTELRPPAKLSIAALAGALVLSVALMIGLHVDDRRLRTAYEADLRERTTEILAHATAEQLRVPLAIGDRELVAQAAEELLRREPRLQGITMRLPSGDVVPVGQAPAQSIARELSLVGPATSTEALLLGATTSSTASSRPLAQLAVHVGDLREGHPTPSIHRVTPWLLLSFPLVGLAGALWFRRRLLRLCEISSRVAEGELDHGPHLGGGDELAWAAAHLHHATAVVAQHVEHVQGRNAALRRDVTLKEDRLQRIAGFAATLVAPLQELDIGQQA